MQARSNQRLGEQIPGTGVQAQPESRGNICVAGHKGGGGKVRNTRGRVAAPPLGPPWQALGAGGAPGQVPHKPRRPTFAAMGSAAVLRVEVRRQSLTGQGTLKDPSRWADRDTA